MAEHTAGPWKILSWERLSQIPVGDTEGLAVAAVYLRRTEKEEEANAHLIAAAPDLLALAKAYEAWEADLVINGDWSGETVRMTQAQHDRLIEIQTMRNAAIAKAKGQAS